MDDVDFSAAATLRETYDLLKQRNVRLVFLEVQDHVRVELERSKITDLVGRQYFFNSLNELENAFRASSEATVKETPGNN